MQHLVKLFISVMMFPLLSGCSMLFSDCNKLSSDPSAYRKCTASQGSQQSQYELGLAAFNQQDYKTTIKWLKLAAATKSGRTPIYMPAVGSQKYGSVMMLDTGAASAGHRAAQVLLADMYDKGLGVKANPDRAEKYRKMAQ